MPYLLTRNKKKDFSARVQLPETPAVIGRTSAAEVQIQDQSISKVHASIEPLESGRFRLTDMGSRNGIFYKGKRHREIEVGVGDEIKLGNVTVTICGEEKTLPIPDLVKKPPPAREPTAEAPAGTGSSIGMLLSSSERRLLAVFVFLLVGLGAVFYFLPSDDGDGDPPTDPTERVADQPSGVYSGSEPPVVDTAADPGDRRPVAPEIRAHEQEQDRESWSALAATLDQTCSTAGCHAVASAVDFRTDGGEDFGRWERNLLELRSRTTFTQVDGGWQLAAFKGTGPHQKPMPLDLDVGAVFGVEALGTASGRLLAADPERPPFEMLQEFSVEEMRRLRRAWLLLFDRVPTIDEIYVHASRTPIALLDEAREKPEFWRTRARRELRGRGEFDSRGNFHLPLSLLPDQVPASSYDWGERLRRVINKTRGRVSIPYRADAPLPSEGDSDVAFRGWYLNAIGEPPRPLSPDVYLNNVWSALWGRPPTTEEAQLLRESLAPELDWPELRRAVVSFLVYAPRTPAAPVRDDMDATWVSGVVKYLLGAPLAMDQCEAVATRMSDGSLDARVFLEECLLSKEWEYD